MRRILYLVDNNPKIIKEIETIKSDVDLIKQGNNIRTKMQEPRYTAAYLESKRHQLTCCQCGHIFLYKWPGNASCCECPKCGGR